MQRLVGIGLQAVDLEGGTLRGHTFHYSSLHAPHTPHTHARRANLMAFARLFRPESES